MEKITNYEDFINENDKSKLPKKVSKIKSAGSTSAPASKKGIVSATGLPPTSATKNITPKFWSIKQAKPEHKKIALDILNALRGFTEDETKVIKIIRDRIKTKDDFTGVALVWDYWWPSKLSLRGVSTLDMPFLDKQASTRATRAGISLRRALGFFFNGKEFTTLNSVLPAGVPKIVKVKGVFAFSTRPTSIDYPELNKESLIDVLMTRLNRFKKDLSIKGEFVSASIEKICRNYRAAKK